jgi:DNA-binding MarR family transcriptional regulator
MAARRPATPKAPSSADLAAFEDAFVSFLRALRVARGRAAKDPSFAGPSLAQYQLLEAVDAVGREGNARVAELAGTAEPTSTRALAALERRGLLTRDRGSDDRRSLQIILTAAGRRELANKRALLRRRLKELYGSLNAHERSQAVVLMERLAELIESL